jgi:prepilin-type N-terminal cleavage/methylation domain-containing protein/prepilin-type processing-associated H-X9-DG protein
MKSRTAFTLVELLVVIAVIGILVSIMLPAINAVRDNARRLQCTNNLRNVGLALLTYHGSHKRLPIGVQLRQEQSGAFTGEIGKWKYPGTTAFALILPFVEERRAYDLYDFRKGFYDPVNRDAVRTSVAIFRCPSDLPSTRRATVDVGDQITAVVARSNYAVCFGDDLLFASQQNPDTRGAFRADGSRKIDDFRDGSTKTILASEVRAGLLDGGGGSSSADTRGIWSMQFAGSAIYTHRLEPNSLDGDLIKGRGLSLCQKGPGMPCKSSRTSGYYRDYAGARSNHAGGVNVVFADGHMLFVNDEIDIDVWRAASTIDNSKFEVEVDIGD